jgi:hypothetical protein
MPKGCGRSKDGRKSIAAASTTIPSEQPDVLTAARCECRRKKAKARTLN